jgi:hypothetical protein
VNLRPAWVTWRVLDQLGIHSETLSPKKNKNEKEKKNQTGSVAVEHEP